MNKQDIYKSLEDDMLGYSDLVGVPVRPVQEKLVPIESMENLVTKPINSEMQPYTGMKIYVRTSVASRLHQAARALAVKDARLKLQVVYGYRALSIQRRLFLKYKNRLEKQYAGDDLIEATHRLIAVPEIAGHPTGGAVDIQIIRDDMPIDMGTNIWEFVKNSFAFSPFINRAAQANRKLLRNVMMEAGFAPFDGEWWHFSYGDKEWATYYKKSSAMYEQLEFKELTSDS